MLPLSLQQVYQADLVLRGDTRNHADIVQFLGQLIIAHGGKLGAGQGCALDAQLMPDGGRRHGVVAGDHAHLDAGAVALGDGVLGLGARRIDDADHGQQGQILHQVDQFALGIEGLRVEVAPRHHHDALAGFRHAVVLIRAPDGGYHR